MAIKMAKKNANVKRVVKKIIPDKVVGSKGDAKVAKSNVKMPTGEYFEGVGRRKTSVARVRIYPTQGDYVVNGQLVGTYFGGLRNASSMYNKPFDLTSTKGKFSVAVKVSGSGVRGQLGALLHGLSRALIKFNAENRAFLKSAGLLTRDDRMKETRKIGMGGKARRKRQSPKR